jgi:hypothetical protein
VKHPDYPVTAESTNPLKEIKLKTLLAAALTAAFAMPAAARDISFTFNGEYQGKSFAVGKLSSDDCGKLLVKPLVMIPTGNGSRLAVPATDVKNRQCVASGESETPDQILRFVNFPLVKVYRRDDGTSVVQVGNGPKVDLNTAARFSSWEDDTGFYYFVDNLIFTDKSGKKTCYEDESRRFPCDAN